MNTNKALALILIVGALIVLTWLGFGTLNNNSVADHKATVEKTLDMNSEEVKLGYTMGATMGRELARSGILENIDLEAFLAAIRDMATGADAKMTDEQMTQAQSDFQARQLAEYQAIANKNLTDGETYRDQNKAGAGVKVTDSGLQYKVIREGKGAQPTDTDSVQVHYVGTLISGDVFDSSYQRNEPATFPVTGVIPGFSEGLKLMKEGAKYQFVIPAELAYGESAPPSIGPNQTLIFEVELLDVVDEETKEDAS